MKYITSVLLLACIGCGPSMSEIRTSCEDSYGYRTARYNDCVSDAVVEAEAARQRRRLVLMGISNGLQGMGNSLQQSSQYNRQANCSTMCNMGMCYTHCQ